MNVTVYYLAQLRRAAGSASEGVDLKSPASVTDLLALVVRNHGEELRRVLLDSAGSLQPTILVFVNDEQAQPQTPLKDGDCVTFLSPIAGG